MRQDYLRRERIFCLRPYVDPDPTDKGKERQWRLMARLNAAAKKLKALMEQSK